ncbi:MAG: DUF748 domain-containing protein, partial [Moraxellaceae bacterium]|nr:DUF748 domain-containing protein [Moraxellaceae bacterium]
MLPAQLTNRLPPALQSQLTPRRQRISLALLVLALLYSLLGFLMLPGVVISQAKKFVQDELKLELSIERLQVNPWRLAVRIDGLGIKEPGGETLIAARSVFINAQLWHSLWMRGASLDELDLLEPYVNARLRQDGSLNLLQLLPPEDPASTGDTAWRIGKLGIHAARIDVHDDSRPTPFSTVFSPLNLALTEIGSRPDADGNYNLRAETGEQEVLEWEGTLALQPLRSTGTLAIRGLRATTPWRYLQDDLPVVVKDGRISIKARYDLVAAEEVKLNLADGQISVDDLKLHQKSANPLHVALQHIELAGLTLAWPASTAGFDSVVVQDFQLLDKPLAPPLAAFGKLSFAGGRYEPQPESVSLKSLVLNDLLLADTPGNTALMALPSLELHALSADMATQMAHVSRIVLNAGNVAVLREKDGGLNWERQLAALEKRVADGMPASTGNTTASSANKTTSTMANSATSTSVGSAAAAT